MTTRRLATSRELETIHKIAERAVAFYQRHGMLVDRGGEFVRTGIADEVRTVHEEIVPLRLDEMLDGRDGDFMHDIAGIHHHLEQDGKRSLLTRCFMPRFAHV